MWLKIVLWEKDCALQKPEESSMLLLDFQKATAVHTLW